MNHEGTLKRIHLRSIIPHSRRWRALLLTLLLVFTLPLTLLQPLRTAKGLVVDTGIGAGSSTSFAVEDGRIAMLLNASIVLYDVEDGMSVSFAAPPGVSTSPGNIALSGDRIVTSNSTGSVFYCTLPHTLPPTICGPWQLVNASNHPNCNSFCAATGPATISGDLIAWPITHGVAYYHFSSDTISYYIFTPTPGMFVDSVSTNGRIIAFIIHEPPPQCPYACVWYLDTSDGPPPGTTHSVDDTTPIGGIYGGTSMYHNIIAYEKNSTDSPTTRGIRYYDISRTQWSNVAIGPTSQTVVTRLGTPFISPSQIVFLQSCGASAPQCLGWWNYQKRSFQSDFLDPSASPAGGVGFAVSGNMIVFVSGGSFHYVLTPLKGDVNLDGEVNISDLVDAASCFGQSLLGGAC